MGESGTEARQGGAEGPRHAGREEGEVGRSRANPRGLRKRRLVTSLRKERTDDLREPTQRLPGLDGLGSRKESRQEEGAGCSAGQRRSRRAEQVGDRFDRRLDRRRRRWGGLVLAKEVGTSPRHERVAWRTCPPASYGRLWTRVSRTSPGSRSRRFSASWASRVSSSSRRTKGRSGRFRKRSRRSSAPRPT